MANSSRKGKKGERELGRFLLREGYLFWRTEQNRGSVRDEHSADVSSMAPEHMLVENGEECLDYYYIDQSEVSQTGEKLVPVEEFTPLPNLRIEAKHGYDAKTYNKQFQDWIEKLKEETPSGWLWALFYHRKWSGEWRVAFPFNETIVMTIDEEETKNALPIIERLCKEKRQS